MKDQLQETILYVNIQNNFLNELLGPHCSGIAGKTKASDTGTLYGHWFMSRTLQFQFSSLQMSLGSDQNTEEKQMKHFAPGFGWPTPAIGTNWIVIE